MLRSTLLTLALSASVSAHTAAWASGMYCRGGGDPNVDVPNNNLAVGPLWNHTKEDWWFQHHRGCDAVPPKAGEFLELPANSEFTVELAHNRAFTTLSYDGKVATDWPDGKQHPEDWNGWGTDGKPAVCLKEDGALHTWNQSWAGGTAFAISYQSELKDVTMENLVVFSTLYHTPWKRLATYKVPDLPACPEGGCACTYMQGFKCNVTNASPTAAPLAKAQAPVYCEDEPDKCVQGAKQMLAWQQFTGNNIETEHGVTPNYNQKCGWQEGAQTDIFEKAANAPSSSASVSLSIPTASAPAYSYSEFFSAAPVPTSTTSLVAPPAVYSEFFSAVPYSQVSGVPSVSTLVTHVSSASSVLATPMPVENAVTTSSSQVTSTTLSTAHAAAVSAVATSSKVPSVAKHTHWCSGRRARPSHRS